MKTRIIYDSYTKKYFAQRRYFGLFWFQMTDWYAFGDGVHNQALYGFDYLNDAKYYINGEEMKLKEWRQIEKEERSKERYKIVN